MGYYDKPRIEEENGELFLTYEVTLRQDADGWEMQKKVRKKYNMEGWGMFTSKGNKRIRTISERLLREVKKAKNNSQVVKALDKYHKTWYDMDRYESYREAGDTAVRECVGCFHDAVGDSVGINGADIWEAFGG
jgi:hypothetical protein